jgi:hypothetical protein
VRGMNERYSTVLLNGLPVAMTEPDAVRSPWSCSPQR